MSWINNPHNLQLAALLYVDYGLGLGREVEVTVDTSPYGIPFPRKGETVVLGTESLPDDFYQPTFPGFDIRQHGEQLYVRCYSPEHNDVWWYPASGLTATGNASIGPTIDTIIPLGSERGETDG